jgi:hypothetical protein
MVESSGFNKLRLHLESDLNRFVESKPALHSAKQCEIGCGVLYREKWRARLVDKSTVHLVDKGNTERISDNEKLIILPERFAAFKPLSLPLTEVSEPISDGCFVRIVAMQKDHYCGYRYTIEKCDDDDDDLCPNPRKNFGTEMMKIMNYGPRGKSKIEFQPNMISPYANCDFFQIPMISQDNEEFLTEMETILLNYAECNTLKPAFPLQNIERDPNKIYLWEVDATSYIEHEIHYARVKIVEKRNKICDVELIDYGGTVPGTLQITQVYDSSLFNLEDNMLPDKFPVITELLVFEIDPSNNTSYDFFKQMVHEDECFEVTKHDSVHAEITDKRFKNFKVKN